MYGMKMTMHIDAALLDKVIHRYGFSSKTEAVDQALREMDRKASYNDVVKKGMKASANELKTSVEPDYNIHVLRAAEDRPHYGKSHGRTRRH